MTRGPTATSFAVTLALAATACGSSSEPSRYQPNTVLDIPADGDIADPHVIKVGATWYLYATNAPHELLVWLSEDLRHWRSGGAVWKPTPGSWNDGQGVWAPHVQIAAGGSYYLYISANLRIGVAHADNPLGPFVDVLDHPLVGNGYGHVGNGIMGDTPLDYDEHAIDAFVLADDNGSLTLFFSAYDPLSKIYAIPMLDYTTLVDVAPKLVLATDAAWEGVIAEGTWVEKHDGRYHLMYSGNIYLTTNYAIGVAEAENVLGPYQKYADNPLLHTDMDAGFFAPGHNSLVAGFGADRLIFYHTKLTDSTGADRRIRYAPIRFGSDGQIKLTEP